MIDNGWHRGRDPAGDADSRRWPRRKRKDRHIWPALAW